MTAPAMGWNFGITLYPNEIEALRAGEPVTRTYPAPLYDGPPPLLADELEALKGGKRVIKMTTSLPGRLLQVGAVVPVMSSDRADHRPPALLSEELEALLAGKTVMKKRAQGTPPPRLPPDLHVKVVEYRHQGNDHTYTFEPV